ncbi:uncharacterized protein LAESUDRAFT_764782 [Laetiporus sulphureus 93-53]|uniref:Uncharacterized protein n=1 Tax=Laetiporus sulphureus 93-53 TaxID=1314785 RepID=A0A165B4U5_9APHY|nr:uncharacterized protein LAESUDRAFT_764782 [Laetiporus sulphureus 93-53]KZT00242.1 hypothetical protein LAESUDRAFT_764782 [Laetiporus sulphureus 93-53]
MVSAEEVYAKQLFKLGKGYPLWIPEPRRREDNVVIGDVGFLNRGGFFRIFNAMEDHESASDVHGLPSGHTVFRPSLPAQRFKDAVSQGTLHSESMHMLPAQRAPDEHGAQLGFECECTDDRGALLVVGSPVVREELHRSVSMGPYMKKNMNRWVSFAQTQLDLDITEDEIVWVCGHVKTSQWAVGAYLHQSKGAKISFSGDLGLPASASFSVHTSETALPSYEHRSGPKKRRTLTEVGKSQQTSHGPTRNTDREGSRRHRCKAPDDKPDQCIFIHFIKMKRRRFRGRKIVAMAEPRDPSFHKDDDMMQIAPAQENWNPVDDLLDYVLDYSDADIAIASDIDLIEICKAHNKDNREYLIPEDVCAFLGSVRPFIEVTEDKIGRIVLDESHVTASDTEDIINGRGVLRGHSDSIDTIIGERCVDSAGSEGRDAYEEQLIGCKTPVVGLQGQVSSISKPASMPTAPHHARENAYSREDSPKALASPDALCSLRGNVTDIPHASRPPLPLTRIAHNVGRRIVPAARSPLLTLCALSR